MYLHAIKDILLPFLVLSNHIRSNMLEMETSSTHAGMIAIYVTWDSKHGYDMNDMHSVLMYHPIGMICICILEDKGLRDRWVPSLHRGYCTNMISTIVSIVLLDIFGWQKLLLYLPSFNLSHCFHKSGLNDLAIWVKTSSRYSYFTVHGGRLWVFFCCPCTWVAWRHMKECWHVTKWTKNCDPLHCVCNHDQFSSNITAKLSSLRKRNNCLNKPYMSLVVCFSQQLLFFVANAHPSTSSCWKNCL